MADDERRKDGMQITYEQYLIDIHSIAFNLFKQMEAELGRETALRILRNAGDRYGKELARRHASKENIRTMADFEAFFDRLITSPLMAATQDSHIIERGPRRMGMRVTRCMWADTFKELGDVDAGFLMCCYPDLAMVKGLDPHLRLKRTRTIMGGDDHCDHCFHWED